MWDTIKKTVGNIVPELAKAIIPGSGLAIDLISGIFGVDKNDEIAVLKAVKNATPDQILELKKATLDNSLELEKISLGLEKLRYQDKADSRNMNIELQRTKGSWLVKNTGSMVGMITIIGAFLLDIYILYHCFANSLDTLNPVITLIAGGASAKAIQVLSFYFGDNKAAADAKRKD